MAVPTATYFTGDPLNSGSAALLGGSVPANLIIRLFGGYQDYLDPTEVPLTNKIKTGKTVNQKKVEWFTGFLTAHQVEIEVYAAGTTLTLASGEGSKVMVSDLLLVDSEIFWVRDKSGDVLTVEPEMGGTTNAAHADGTIAEILGPAALENADSPLAPTVRGALEYNLPQRFDYAVQVDNRADVTPDYEYREGNVYDRVLEKRMKSAAIHFEKTLVNGRRGEEVAITGATATPSTMGGLDFFTDQSTDLSGAPLTWSAMLTAQQTIWNSVDEEHQPRDWYMGATMKRALSSLYPYVKLADIKDDRGEFIYSSANTDFGTMRFHLSRYIPAGRLYLVNTQSVTKNPYKGGDWVEVALPASGPYKKGRFTGDFTTVWQHNAARWKIVNASTDMNDYPE